MATLMDIPHRGSYKLGSGVGTMLTTHTICIIHFFLPYLIWIIYNVCPENGSDHLFVHKGMDR